jgi:predicted phage-related endonuclease
MPLPQNMKSLQRSEKWHDKRATGIGGSDWSGVLSSQFPEEHKWSCMRRTYLDKIGAPKDFPPKTGAAAQRGQLLEGVVADIFKADYEISYVGFRPVAKELLPGVPLPEWWIGNPDRVILEKNGEHAILEIKTMMREVYFNYLENGAPDHYKIQPMHYLGRTGLENAYLAVFWPDGAGFQVEPYPRDPETLLLMLDAGKYFWGLVESKSIPDRCPLTDERCGQCPYRKTCRPGHYDGHETDGSVDLDATTWAPPIVEHLIEVKAQISELEKEEKEITEALKAGLEQNGDVEIATCCGQNIKFEKTLASKVDYDAIREKHPDIMREFTSAVPRRALYVRKMAKKKS